MRLIYDPDQVELAERIGRAFPRWFVTWGAYSRQLWAFPRFRVPQGTIAHAADPGDLARMMRAIERSAATGGAR